MSRHTRYSIVAVLLGVAVALASACGSPSDAQPVADARRLDGSVLDQPAHDDVRPADGSPALDTGRADGLAPDLLAPDAPVSDVLAWDAMTPDLLAQDLPAPDLAPTSDLVASPDVNVGPKVAIGKLSYPPLFPGDRFPTAFSHLIGSPVLALSLPLVELTLTNSGSAAAFASVEVELSSYSTPATQSVQIPPGGSVDLELSPALDLVKLFAQTSDVPSNIRTTVRVGGAIVAQQTHQVIVLGRNGLLLTQANPYAAVFVTPNDKAGAVAQLLAAAAQQMPGKAMVGYQSLAAKPLTTSIAVGYVHAEPVYLLAKQQICGTLTTVQGGLDADLDVYAFDETNYQAFLAGQVALPLLHRADAVSGATFCFSAVADGWHYLAYYNTPDNFLSRSMTRSRDASHHEGTLMQAEALFAAVQKRGMSYVNTPGGAFWSGVQSVKYPSETWAQKTGNCIDGTLLFAAAFEALGMRPVLVLVPGHALVAVRSWSNEDTLIPLETTMVGSGSFDGAWQQGTQTVINAQTSGTAELLELDLIRPLGIGPAPM